jgi:hypothetical protein
VEKFASDARGSERVPQKAWTGLGSDAIITLSVNELVGVLKKRIGRPTYKTLALFFTDMHPYEDPVLELVGESKVGMDEPPKVIPADGFIRALFWLPTESRYVYLRLVLKKSIIPKAGLGVYAHDTIPKDAMAEYLGDYVEKKYANMHYSWEVRSFDVSSGELDELDDVLFYRDCSDPKTANWTRFVNCGLKKEDNNFDQVQIFSHVFYVSTKVISRGMELFIDYGPAYRKTNLGMKGRY